MKREDVFALAGLAGLTVLLFWQYLFVPGNLIYPVSALGTDLPREVYPLAYYVKSQLTTTGELPLWRPYLLSGAPLIGHPVAPILYPPYWLVAILPIATALNVDIVLHIVLMVFGTYLYLRLHRGNQVEAAFVGALLFAQSPKWIAHISGGHWPMLSAIAWWPWIWLGYSRYRTTGRLRWVVVLAIGMAAQVMNHGTYAMLTGLALACYSVMILILDRGSGFKRLVACWGVTVPLAGALAAGHLLPLIELMPYASRGSLSYTEAAFGSLPPILLLGMFFPSELKFPEWFLYPGVGALALLAYGAHRGWPRREKLVAMAGIAGLVLSLGSNTPIYGILYRIIPLYSYIRVPARWWILSLFALAVLSAWAVDEWLSHASERRKSLALIFFSMGAVYGLVALMKVLTPDLVPFDVLLAAIALILLSAILLRPASRLGFVLLVAIIAFDVRWTAGGLIRPMADSAIAEPSPVDRLLQQVAQSGERSFAPYGGIEASHLALYDLRAADGYDSFLLRSYSDLGRMASGCDYQGYAVSVPPTASSPQAIEACPKFQPDMDILALLNVRYVLLPAEQSIEGATLVLRDGKMLVYELPAGLGRAFGVSEGIHVEPQTCLKALTGIDVSEQVLVEETLPFEPGLARPIVMAIDRQANGEVFQVKASTGGLLIRSESWAPGWKVAVDGKPTWVLRVDCALQGVWLEAGEHTVRFFYAPDGYLVGRWISLAATGVLLAGSLVTFVVTQKK